MFHWWYPSRVVPTLLKEQVSNVICVLLCHNPQPRPGCKTPPLKDSLNVAVKAIYKIKTHVYVHDAMTDCSDNHVRIMASLLFHNFSAHLLTERHWLAFSFGLFGSIQGFLEKVDAALEEKVISIRFFLRKWMKSHLSSKEMQCKIIIHSMNFRLDLSRQSIDRCHFTLFPQLAKMINSISGTMLMTYYRLSMIISDVLLYTISLSLSVHVYIYD